VNLASTADNVAAAVAAAVGARAPGRLPPHSSDPPGERFRGEIPEEKDQVPEGGGGGRMHREPGGTFPMHHLAP